MSAIQQMLAGLGGAKPMAGSTFTARAAPSGTFNQAVGISGDGSIIFAVSTSGIFRTTNDGATWTSVQSYGSGVNSSGVLCSTTGEFVVAPLVYSYDPGEGPVNDFQWNRSSNFGTTFSAISGAPYFSPYSLVGNTDLSVIYWTDGAGVIRKSTDRTNNGVNILPVNYNSPRGVVCSSDGVYVIACMYKPVASAYRILRSTDSGSTWAETTASSPTQSYTMAMSADGKNIIVLYNDTTAASVSTDFGVTWTDRTFAHSTPAFAACSSDASRIFVSGGSGNIIYRSTNMGQSWEGVGPTGLTSPLQSLRCSADGSKLVVSHAAGMYVVT